MRVVNSRDFTRDILVTTLGVLIALGIGAIVDAIRWRMRLASSEKIMDEELSRFRGATAFHVLSHQCTLEKIAALFEITEQARLSGRLPDIRGIGFTIDFGAFGDSWALLQGGDTLLHLPPKDAMGHAARWVNIKYMSDRVTMGNLAWQQLGIIAQRPGPASSDFIDSITRDLITAVRSAETVYAMGLREDDRLAKAGIERLSPGGQEFNLQEVRDQVAASPICQKLTVDGKPYQLKTPSDPVELPKDLVG